MPRNRQNKLEIARRRLRVARLYLQRMRMVDIAVDPEVAVAVSTVCKDIKALKGEWLKESTEAIALVKGRELAELDQMERDACALFSVAARWRVVDGVPVELPNHSRAQGWVEKRIKIKEQRIKLLGLVADEQDKRAAAEGREVTFRAVVAPGGVVFCKKVEDPAK